MPDSTTITPPPIAKTAVAPTPQGEYKLSEHAPAPTRSDAALRAALEKRAGQPPAVEGRGEPKVIPAQPPRAPLSQEAPVAPPTTPASDEKPAPHVKFIVPDEAPPAAQKAPDAPAAPSNDDPPEAVLKSASAQLREAYDKVKAQRDEVLKERDLTKKEAGEFRTRLATLEERAKALEGSEARAKELEQRVLLQEEKLRIAAYQETDEYHNTYRKPVSDAMSNAYALVKELQVSDVNGERLGTAEDFHAVLAQPNYTLMKAKARELFGDFSTEVFEASRHVREAQQREASAVKDAALRSKEWHERQAEQGAASRTQARAAFEARAKELTEAHRDLYLPKPDDNEAIAARKSGEELALLMVMGKPSEMPAEEYLSRLAKGYQRAASWPMHQLQLHRLTAELEATKARLAAYEKSSPDTSSAQRPGGITEIGNTPVNGADQLRAQLRKSLEQRASRRT